ncbi:helix-turn-helix transcriptional regulator [Desulfobacter postgatei]|uniref:helix-turn-helix transcriptional regulator n=1 Tax=Desulfobacter postgatei TaxID=2293 RepID=UPI00259B32B8|nr:helix-turn-helix transcriptional regulator [uncultured Desulfobacter sp.]
MKTTITSTADKIGISQGYLSNIVLGRRRPNPDLALKISQLTQTPLETWLFKSEKNLELRKKAVKKRLQSSPRNHNPVWPS